MRLGLIGRCWTEWFKIFAMSFALSGQDVKQDLPPKQKLQTATNHDKDALLISRGAIPLQTMNQKLLFIQI